MRAFLDKIFLLRDTIDQYIQETAYRDPKEKDDYSDVNAEIKH